MKRASTNESAKKIRRAYNVFWWKKLFSKPVQRDISRRPQAHPTQYNHWCRHQLEPRKTDRFEERDEWALAHKAPKDRQIGTSLILRKERSKRCTFARLSCWWRCLWKGARPVLTRDKAIGLESKKVLSIDHMKLKFTLGNGGILSVTNAYRTKNRLNRLCASQLSPYWAAGTSHKFAVEMISRRPPHSKQTQCARIFLNENSREETLTAVDRSSQCWRKTRINRASRGMAGK